MKLSLALVFVLTFSHSAPMVAHTPVLSVPVMEYKVSGSGGVLAP